ncbi:MAG: septation protein SpoVG family protein [Candidatus Omnitrophica bacterium]|nr:septation protein SpoVG family protein [Candidatus Omnitrophota bacterium]
MKITEVRIFPTKSKDGRLKAYATMTFDDWFVVRNVKIIEGNNGLFVAMPSRKMMDPCPKCGFKNVRGSKYCNECGSACKRHVSTDDSGRRQSEHVDIAHPIRQECRIYIQDMILEGYNAEIKRKASEGDSYRPASQEDLDVVSQRFAGPEKPPKEPVQPEGLGIEDETQDIEL